MTSVVHGQPEELGMEDTPPNPAGIPVDGGIGMLIGAGIAYGVRKILIKNKRLSHD